MGLGYIFIKKAQAPTARVMCINRVRSMVKAQAVAEFSTAPAQVVSSGLICLHILVEKFLDERNYIDKGISHNQEEVLY